ncbi:putative acetyltransferase [Pseudarthrobacter sp. 1C304]|uniref:putative acetyltransferase n=1 Tax=Pseudarthrobacter sp. 1C304 TaxID=3457438 RepID=UPI003FD527EE
MSTPTPLPPLPPQAFLAAAELGTRVVVRYKIEGGMTDALGELVARTAGECTVRTRRSDVVIPFPLVVAAKEVPPAPPRRSPRPGGHALP